MKFNCGNCGEIDCVIVDGYGYGDRLLEGVTFEVRRDDEGKYHAQVEEFSRDYFAQFNTQMYLGRIEHGMETEEFAICPTCGEEVLINKVEPRPTLEVQMQPISAILGGAFAGATIAMPDEDVGERTRMPLDRDEEEQTETQVETSSAEGGDSGGGGASEDLDDKDGFEPEEDEEEAEEEEDEENEEEDDSSSDES